MADQGEMSLRDQIDETLGQFYFFDFLFILFILQAFH